MLALIVSLASCSKDDEEPKLAAPAIVQKEAVSENPLTLAFSWEKVEGATSYSYSLVELNAAGEEVSEIVSKTTTDLSVQVADTKDTPLYFGTQYCFKVKAISSTLTSEATTANVTTPAAPFELTITDLTYRGATFSCVPTDKSGMYEVAQISLDKYTPYESDSAFIEDYDFGYYKAVKASMPWIPVSWYEIMADKDYHSVGDYSWKTRILEPEHEYIMYAYGFKIDNTDAEHPVKLTTPLVKKRFTTPAWKATSATTFTVALESEIVADGKVTSTVKVTPSSNAERYFVAFCSDSKLQSNYNGSAFTFMLGRMGDCEKLGQVKDYDWSTCSLLHTGTQTISNTETGLSTDKDITPGQKYYVIVCGISDDGQVTTEIVSVPFIAIEG